MTCLPSRCVLKPNPQPSLPPTATFPYCTHSLPPMHTCTHAHMRHPPTQVRAKFLIADVLKDAMDVQSAITRAANVMERRNRAF